MNRFRPASSIVWDFGYDAARRLNPEHHHGQQQPARADRVRGATTPASATWPAPYAASISWRACPDAPPIGSVRAVHRFHGRALQRARDPRRAGASRSHRRRTIHRHGAGGGGAAFPRAGGAGVSRSEAARRKRTAIAMRRWRRTASIRRAVPIVGSPSPCAPTTSGSGSCRTRNWHDLGADPALTTLAGRKRAEDRIDAALSRGRANAMRTTSKPSCSAPASPRTRCSIRTSCRTTPQLESRGFIRRIAHPQFGTTAIEGSRVLMSGAEAAEPTLAVSYGSHNAVVLGDILGYSAERIAQLAAERGSSMNACSRGAAAGFEFVAAILLLQRRRGGSSSRGRHRVARRLRRRCRNSSTASWRRRSRPAVSWARR